MPTRILVIVTVCDTVVGVCTMTVWVISEGADAGFPLGVAALAVVLGAAACDAEYA